MFDKALDELAFLKLDEEQKEKVKDVLAKYGMATRLNRKARNELNQYYIDKYKDSLE